jgi:hypothetical protein
LQLQYRIATAFSMSLFDLSAVSSFLKIIQYHHIAAGTSHRLHHVEARFLDSARTFIIAALAALGHSLELHTVANDHAASTHDDVCITWYFGFDFEPNAIGERVLVELAAAGDGGISFERLARDIVRACADVMCTTHPALTAHWRSISVDMMSVSGEDGMEGYEMCPMAAVNKVYVPSVNRFLPAHVALWKTWREQRDERTMYAEWFLEFLIWLPHEFLHCVDSAFRTDADFACSCTPLQRDWSFEHCACFAQFHLMYSMAAHMPTIQLGDDGGNLATISLPAHVFFEAHLLLLRGTRLHTAFDNADQCSGSGDVVADASLSATIAKSNDTCATPESELTAVLADTRALRSRLALWCGDESVLPFNALTPNEVCF